MKKRPVIQIIAGSNGSGKSTFAGVFLRKERLLEFLNADALAQGLSPISPELYSIRAGRILLERWNELANARKSFAVESTLSGLTYIPRLKILKKRGYQVRIAYLWLPSVTMALQRIRQRVIKGGHNVPSVDVRRRFISGFRNLIHFYIPLADEVLLYDASSHPPELLAAFQKGLWLITNKEIL